MNRHLFICFESSSTVKNNNPWDVTSINSFDFLCCPECVFRSKEESIFEKHALENHPKSKKFFKPECIETEA